MYKIRSKIPYLLFLLLLSLFTINVGLCQDEASGEEVTVERTCPQYIFDVLVQVLPKLFKCLFGKNRANLRFANFYEYLSRFWCILKCILAEMEILGDDGLMDETSAIIVGQDLLPEWAVSRLAGEVGHCVQLTEKFKGSQYFCQSYVPFFQCALTSGLSAGASVMADCIGPPILNGFLGVLRIFVPPTNEGGGEDGENAVRRGVKSPRNRTTLTIPLFNRFAAMLFSSQMEYELANIRAKGKSSYRSNSSNTKKTKKQYPNKPEEVGNNTTVIAIASSTAEKYNQSNLNKNNNRSLMFELAANNKNLIANTQNIFSTAQTLVNAFWKVQRQFTGNLANRTRSYNTNSSSSLFTGTNNNNYYYGKYNKYSAGSS